MIITTNNLNNIETKITTPQIEGVEFINVILDEDEEISGINASYNDIMAIIEDEKLPIIVFNNNKVKCFFFIESIFLDDSVYVVLLIRGLELIAENATTNMTVGHVTSPF